MLKSKSKSNKRRNLFFFFRVLWAGGWSSFVVFCRGRARESRGSLVYKASVETGSESLRATHGRGAEAQRGLPGCFPSCWTGMPFARGNFVICFMVVKYLSLRVLFLTLCCPASCSPRWGWVLFLLQSSLMSPRRRSRKLCLPWDRRPGWDRPGASLSPCSSNFHSVNHFGWRILLIIL